MHNIKLKGVKNARDLSLVSSEINIRPKAIYRGSQ